MCENQCTKSVKYLSKMWMSDKAIKPRNQMQNYYFALNVFI